jgi:hypothetical protein
MNEGLSKGWHIGLRNEIANSKSGDALTVIFGNEDDILSNLKGKHEELT